MTDSYKNRGRAAPKNHTIYTEYIKCLKLNTSDFGSLKKRGLKSEHILRAEYGSKPSNNSKIAHGAIAHVNAKYDLDEVPGFFIGDNGYRNHKGTQGKIIPSRDVEGNICSLIIRLYKPHKQQGRIVNKYMAFSSAGETKGEKVWQNTHCPVVQGKPKDVAGTTIRITEGVLKADVATALGKYYCIGFHGVNPHRDLHSVLEELEVSTVHIAYDAERDAADVMRGLAKTYKALKEFGVDVYVECWNPEFGKGIDDVIKNGHEDKIEILSKEELDELLTEADGLNPENGEWVYVVAEQKFYHIDNFLKLNKSQFANYFRMLTPKKTDLLISEGFPQVDDIAFAPNKEKFFRDDRMKFLNVWRDPEIKPEKGDVQRLRDHVNYLFPNQEEAQHLLDWLAFTVSKPEEKIHYAVLMKSEHEGVGKSWFGEMLRKILGHDNTCMLSSQMLNENFSGWAKRSCLAVVEEVWSSGKKEFMNKMKPFITQPTIHVREMQREAYEVPNHLNFLMTTNYSDAIRIGLSDRRYLVMVSEAEPKDQEYYTDLFNWIETDEGKAALLHYFTKEHIYHSDFSAKGKAPMTKAKVQLIDISRPPLEQWIFNEIREHRYPFNQPVLAVCDLKKIETCPQQYREQTYHKWNEALGNCGAIKYGQISLSDGSKPTVWLNGDQKDLLKDYPASKIAKIYEDGICDEPI